MKEYLLTTNNFMEPTVETGSDAYATLMLRLLLLEPGTNPLHPEMGVGLGPKYRFISEQKLSELQTLIQNQVNTYLPSDFMDAVTVTIKIKPNTKYLNIIIQSEDTSYVYDTEDSDTPIELSSLIS